MQSLELHKEQPLEANTFGRGTRGGLIQAAGAQGEEATTNSSHACAERNMNNTSSSCCSNGGLDPAVIRCGLCQDTLVETKNDAVYLHTNVNHVLWVSRDVDAVRKTSPKPNRTRFWGRKHLSLFIAGTANSICLGCREPRPCAADLCK